MSFYVQDSLPNLHNLRQCGREWRVSRWRNDWAPRTSILRSATYLVRCRVVNWRISFEWVQISTAGLLQMPTSQLEKPTSPWTWGCRQRVNGVSWLGCTYSGQAPWLHSSIFLTLSHFSMQPWHSQNYCSRRSQNGSVDVNCEETESSALRV